MARPQSQKTHSQASRTSRQNMLRRNNPDPLKIELYNLKDDIGESCDAAAEHPEIVARMRKIMKTGRVPSELFRIPPLDQ